MFAERKMQIMTTNNRYNMSYVKAVDTNTSNLLSAFQKGSIEAFSQLYDLYANVLFNYGCKLTNDLPYPHFSSLHNCCGLYSSILSPARTTITVKAKKGITF